MERVRLIDAPVKRVALVADAGNEPVAIEEREGQSSAQVYQHEWETKLLAGKLNPYQQNLFKLKFGLPRFAELMRRKEPQQAELDLAAPAEHLTEWTLGVPPPCTGWWDYDIVGANEAGRLWFVTKGGGDGMWYQTPGGRPINRHSVIGGTMRWRGLKAPAEAYTYEVPGQPLKRVRLA